MFNYYLTKHIILLKIQNMMDIKLELFQWFIHFLIKSLRMMLLHMPPQGLIYAKKSDFKSKILTNKQ